MKHGPHVARAPLTATRSGVVIPFRDQWSRLYMSSNHPPASFRRFDVSSLPRAHLRLAAKRAGGAADR